MKLRIFLLSIASMFYSCQPNVNKETLDKYSEIISLYPEKLSRDFPSLDNKNILFIELEFPRGRYLSFIHLIIKHDEEEINNLKRDLIDNAKYTYNFTEDCLPLINYTPDLYTKGYFKLKHCNANDELLPISNFAFLNEINVKQTEAINNAKIYVIDAEKGIFLDEDKLSNNGVGLSEEWIHGYSKGVLITENLAVYWLEVW